MDRPKKSDLKTKVRKDLFNIIRGMDLSASNKLPREQELCSMLGVSRITLRAVLMDMANEGILFRQQGRGTFVNPEFFEMKVSFSPIRSYPDMIRTSGFEPRTEIIFHQVRTAGPSIAKKLEIHESDSVLEIIKAFFADNSICALAEDYIPLQLLPEASLNRVEEYPESVFRFLYDATGLKVSWDKAEIDVCQQDDMLRFGKYIKGLRGLYKAFLLLHVVNFDQNNRPVIYAREYVDPSFIKFSQIRQRKHDADLERLLVSARRGM